MYTYSYNWLDYGDMHWYYKSTYKCYCYTYLFYFRKIVLHFYSIQIYCESKSLRFLLENKRIHLKQSIQSLKSFIQLISNPLMCKCFWLVIKLFIDWKIYKPQTQNKVKFLWFFLFEKCSFNRDLVILVEFIEKDVFNVRISILFAIGWFKRKSFRVKYAETESRFQLAKILKNIIIFIDFFKWIRLYEITCILFLCNAL